MKKLMIAAAIVCAAAFSQAATADWTTVDIYGYGSAVTATDLSLYFVESAAYDQSALATALKAKDFSFTENAKVYAAEYLEEGEGYASGGTYGNGETVSGYFVVFDTEDIADAKHFYISEESTGKTGGTGQPATVEFDGSATALAGNWVEVAPEPTSGLLLLVGVAGLALRRRRA